MASAPRLSRVTAVSIRDSPLDMAEPRSESEITCAPERLAASSKETAVLVDASKKARHMVLRASASATRPLANAAARSRISRNSSRLVSSRLKKLLVSNDDHPILPIGLLQVDQDPLPARGGYVLPHVVRPDRQLPVSPVDQNGQPHRRRPSQLQQSVHRRPRRPTRIQNVVHEHHHLTAHVEGHAATPHFGVFVLQVVAVERYVQRTHRDVDALELADVGRDPLCQWNPAREYPDERKAVEARGVAFQYFVGNAA